MSYLLSSTTPEVHDNLPQRLDWIESGLSAVANGGSIPALSIQGRFRPTGGNALTDLTADAPTITFGTSATLTGRYVSPNTGNVQLVGDYGTWDAVNNRQDAFGSGGLDFYFDGQNVEIVVLTSGSTSLPIWLFVDGKPMTADIDTTSVSPISSSTTAYYIKLAFGSSKRRRIEFFAEPQKWYAVECAATDIIEPAPRKPIIAWVGDSFFGGASGAFEVLQAAPFIASRQLGAECYNLGLSGTGYVKTNGSFKTFGDAQRLGYLQQANPELIVVQGSVNDDGQAGVQAAAAATFASWASAFPRVPVIVFGPQPDSATGTIGANRQASIASVKAAAIAASNVIGFHDEVGTAAAVPSAWSSGTTYNEGDTVTYRGSVWKFTNNGTSASNKNPVTASCWIPLTYVHYGTGKVGSTVGDGTRDVTLYSDGTHPTARGQLAFADLLEQQIRLDLANLAAGGAMRVT